MGKPRLCFTLLYSDGDFCLSRNFKIKKLEILIGLNQIMSLNQYQGQ